MLKFLRGRASDRKLRLFGCACCRRIRNLLTVERARAALEAAEDSVDGGGAAEGLTLAADAAWAVATEAWADGRQALGDAARTAAAVASGTWNGGTDPVEVAAGIAGCASR